MEHTLESTEPAITPESVSPTANWSKPTFKKKLAIKRRLTLKRDEFGARSICPPTNQPRLNRIRADEDELQAAIKGLNASEGTTRKLYAQIFNSTNA